MTRGHSRRLPVLAALVILAWLLIAGVSGPFAGRLSSLQKNDLADFLPSTAEATQVLKQGRGFQSATVIPAVIVFERQSGITAADRANVGAATANVTRLKGVVGGASQPIPSADGQALEVIVNVDASTIAGIGEGVH